MVKTTYIPIGLVLALGIKCLAVGISPADAAISVSLIALLALREYMEKHKKLQEVEASTEKKLADMTAAIEMQNKVIKAQAEEFDKLRGTIQGFKLQQGMKEQPANPFLKKMGQ